MKALVMFFLWHFFSLILVSFNNASAGEIYGSISTKIVPAYVISNGANIYNDWVSQSELSINSLLYGVYINIWGSVALTRNNKSLGPMGDEIRCNIGWKKILDKGAYLDAGVYYHDLNKEFTKGGGLGSFKDDLIKPYCEIGAKIDLSEKQNLVVFTKLEQLLPVGEMSPERGAWFFAGLIHNWKIIPKFTAYQQFRLLYDDGAIKKDAAAIGRYGAGLEWEAIKLLKLILAVSIDAPLSHVSDGRKTEVMPTLGLMYKF